MLEQMNEKSYSSEIIANIATTEKTEVTQNLEANQFEVVLNLKSDKYDGKFRADAKIKYSSNDLFSVSLLNTKEKIGLFSEDVLEKYLVSNKSELNNSIKKLTGQETNFSADIVEDTISNITTNKIDIDKKRKASEYLTEIYNLIPEENVTKKENVLVKIGQESINTNSYILSLEGEKQKEILRVLLEKIKNDDELLEKIVTGDENKSSYKIYKNDDFFEMLFICIISNQKMDGTVENIKEIINEEIKKISLISEDLTITIYVQTEENKEIKMVKFVTESNDGTSFDIENCESNKVKITFLKPYKLDDLDNNNEKELLKGYSVEIEKKQSDVNVNYNVQYNNIENKKIISKTIIELKTDKSNSSKGYTTEAIIKYNDSSGEIKVNAKSNVKFQTESIAEDFSEANSIFLDEISNEEAENLYVEILKKLMNVYSEKMENLSLINSNSSNKIVQQPVIQPANIEEKQEIREKLIETVSNMMGEAEIRGEQFTIENLKDLSIEGYDVISIVSDNLAIIKINGYTFNIDKDFMLSE